MMKEEDTREKNRESIAQLRADTGLNQRQFATYFRIPLRTLQDWETGKRRVPEYLLRMMYYVITNECLKDPDAFRNMGEWEIEQGLSFREEIKEEENAGAGGQDVFEPNILYRAIPEPKKVRRDAQLNRLLAYQKAMEELGLRNVKMKGDHTRKSAEKKPGE